MSKFDDSVKVLEDYYNAKLRSANNEEPSSWSTDVEDVESYGDLLDIFDTAEQNAKFSELYTEDRSGDSENPTRETAANQMGLRMQIHFMAGLRRSYRTKFVAGSDNTQLTGADLTRYDFLNKQVALATLNRLKDYLNKQGGEV